MTPSVLLVDDDADVLASLGRFFERREWQVSRASDAAMAVEQYERERPDVVVLDLHLPDMSGLQAIELLRSRDPHVAIIMLTGHANIETAVKAMQLGAENFLTKPIDLQHLAAAARLAYEKTALRTRMDYFSARSARSPGLEALGGGARMRELVHQIEILAPSDTSILLLGETGCGKGWVAQLLHALSTRKSQPFVEVNCAALNATFLESELFGHEKGAFTDARAQKRGLFEVADGGTLLLDEIGDLARELQPKLLTALESRRFRRIGGTRELSSDVRVIAATNRDLEAAVREGSFRKDLYYRLKVMPLELPAVRERGPKEVADLALRVLSQVQGGAGRGPRQISPEAMEAVVRYPWPGNVREMRNVLERIVILAAGDEVILPAHLPPELRTAGELPGDIAEVDLSLEELERRHITRVLAHHAGNRSQAARSLGIARATLYAKLRRHGLMDAATPQ